MQNIHQTQFRHRFCVHESAATSLNFCLVQYPTCLDLLEEKKIDCEPLITHRFGFSEKDIISGFETAAAAGKTGAIKVMFNW